MLKRIVYLYVMGIFPQKTKTQEVTYIDKLVIVVAGKKYHSHDHELQEIRNSLAYIIKKINKMASKTDQALEDLAAIKTQLTKVGNESATLLQKIADLEAAVAAAADTPQSVLDAIADVKAQAQVVDDLVPDAVP